MSSSMIWIVMIAVMVLSMIIQARLKGRFEKYSEVPTGLSGAEVAQRMLQAHGIHDVNIVSIEGTLTDHYNPQTKTFTTDATSPRPPSPRTSAAT